jgi:O-antigen/teichoic acid export membrane protein
MLKNIINTIFVRVFGAIITLIIVVMNSNQTGAEGLGIIGLIVLAISIFIIINGFTTGSLVYFIPRENVFKLLVISYSGVFFTLLFFIVLLNLVDIAPPQYHFHIIFLSVILSVSSIHEKILIGKENIIATNIISLVKILIHIISLSVLYYIFKQNNVLSYVRSLYFSYVTELILLLFFSFKYIKYSGLSHLFSLFKEVFKLSGYNTVATIIQKLNYRLSYYLIEYYFGLKTLGYFSAGIQVSESTLIIGRSISFVQYARISNLKNHEKSSEITVLFVKMMFLISSIVMLILTLLPSSFYILIFGEEFIFTRSVIFSLSIGIIALSCTTVISPFFSGTGNQKLNAQSAFAGFIVTITAGLILIPSFNIIGAGIATSLSYLTSMLYQIYVFKKTANVKTSDFFIKKHDIQSVLLNLRLMLSKNKQL